MKSVSTMFEHIEKGEFSKQFEVLYGAQNLEVAKERYMRMVDGFALEFGREREITFFSAPGRTEIGGNHTDHNHGKVLAAAVNLDIAAVVSLNDDMVIRVKSEGYPERDVIDIASLDIVEEERETSASLIRGVCAGIKAMGYQIGGFDAYTHSSVLKGSGLSSSAAFEVVLVTILNRLYNKDALTPVQAALISQYAENAYFGKPCGLMDQTACAVAGFSRMDFNDPSNPVVEKVSFDLAKYGYAMCIVDTGGNHADLTSEYASIPVEMRSVAQELDGTVLREVEEEALIKRIPALRGKVSDRAILRALHFYADNRRVDEQFDALKKGDFETFKQLVIESGLSSFTYLQNVFACISPEEQGLSLGVALSERLLSGKGGAWRVHGGGFAGTIQAYVPFEVLMEYKTTIEEVFGVGHCHVLSIRDQGGVEIN